MKKLVLFLVLCLCFWSGNAQNARNVTIEGSERRIALVIGNDNYNIDRMKLTQSKKDADLMVVALKRCNFDIVYCANATRAAMYQKLGEFAKKLPNYDVALVYYSGHGAVLNGAQYMLPIDVQSPYDFEGGGETEFEGSAIDRKSVV